VRERDRPDLLAAEQRLEQYWLARTRTWTRPRHRVDRDGRTVRGLRGPGRQPDTHRRHCDTSSSLPATQYPHSRARAAEVAAAGKPPYEPITGPGTCGRSGQPSYKRLTLRRPRRRRTAHLAVPPPRSTPAGLGLPRPGAHVVGSDDWTTCPTPALDQHRHGRECSRAGRRPAPVPESYWGADCSPTGHHGQLHAATGNSGGLKDFDADLIGVRASRSIAIGVPVGLGQPAARSLPRKRTGRADRRNTAQTSFRAISAAGRWPARARSKSEPR